MDALYVVVFEECNGYRAGAVVRGYQVARDASGLDYLLGVGAIVIAKKGTKIDGG